ncbi:9328_t:CDS:2 [Paraglomus brasilianum]|uniref:9328_t:CDS:1 n=1 Tax=Paraglomus brasilianum TaxID=144538 RepID=A0A9N9GGK9_9GLOM|nr:9328_t:CDS:2 [Paraglomus brasilianum]
MSYPSKTHSIRGMSLIRPIIQRLSNVLKYLTQETSESNSLATSLDHMENGSPEANTKSVKQPFDYYICFDVEATCEEGRDFNYANEIIEFPALLIDSKTFDIVDTFHSYVKPSVNPKLSDFCISLTGISQAVVDESPSFPEMLSSFQQFLHRHKALGIFETSFTNNAEHRICCDQDTLLAHGRYELTFEGRQHSGLDDARNIAIIAKRMWMDGAILKANSVVIMKSGKKARRNDSFQYHRI